MKPQAALPEANVPTREEEQAEVIRRLEEDIIFGRFAPGARLVVHARGGSGDGRDALSIRAQINSHATRQELDTL